MGTRTELQRRAAWAGWAAGATAIALLAGMTLEKFSSPLVAALRSGGLDAGALTASAVQLLPCLAYTAALWALRGMFVRVGSGNPFTDEMPRALKTAGLALTAGAAAAVAVEPVLLSILGRGPGYFIALDASAMAIGAVGVGLAALAALLHEAVAMKSELDEFM